MNISYMIIKSKALFIHIILNIKFKLMINQNSVLNNAKIIMLKNLIILFAIIRVILF